MYWTEARLLRQIGLNRIPPVTRPGMSAVLIADAEQEQREFTARMDVLMQRLGIAPHKSRRR